MKTIPLSQGQVMRVSDEDYEPLKQTPWCAYRIAGRGRNGKVYLYGFKAGVKRGGKQLWVHNLLMNPPPGYEVDHVDGDPLNNQRENLRVVTHKENCANRGSQRGSTSRFKGVSWHTAKGLWRVFVKTGDRTTFIGYFDDEEAAALAYNEAALKVLGPTARMNDVTSQTPVAAPAMKLA